MAGYLGGLESLAGVVRVLLHGKEGQGTDVDAVAVLQGVKVAVFEGVAQCVCDAGGVAHGGAHPQHVVIAPDEVHPVAVDEIVHDQLGRGAPVEDVPHDVEPVHREPGDQIGQGDDELVLDPGGDHVVDDALKIPALVAVVLVGVDELLNDIGEFLGQPVADLGPGILVRGLAADGDQPVDGDPVPGIGVVRVGQLPLRVVDQQCQGVFLLLPQQIAEAVVDLGVDGPGGVFQDMGKIGVLPVDIAHEMLGGLGQLQNGLQPDDLRRGGRNIGIVLGKQLQIFDFPSIHGYSLLGL